VTIEVLQPGLQTTLQDAGRPGLAHLGIGRAGAFDAPASRIANALCGNPRDACVLEITLLGPTLRCRDDAWMALTGAPIAFRIGQTESPMWAPVSVPAGATLTLGAMRAGCRSYLAVRGGFDVEPVLGSRSTDVNACIGPLGGRAVRAGDALPAPAAGSGSFFRSNRHFRRGAGENAPAPISWWVDPRPWLQIDPDVPLRVLPGTHLDRLTDASRADFFSTRFNLHADSNRVGVKLRGPALQFGAAVEMVSEGCVPGLLQLPPSGQPIAFGPEGPVSGGYPRIGQIAAVDLPRLAQLRPGDAVRFASCTLAAAVQALERRERALVRLEADIATRLAQ
jgi:antagonist of KipI